MFSRNNISVKFKDLTSYLQFQTSIFKFIHTLRNKKFTKFIEYLLIDDQKD